MDDNERRAIFDRLATILRENGLGWIVDQVTEQIHLGRTISKEVNTVKRVGVPETPLMFDPEAATPDVRRGSKVQFAATVEYNDKERLVLLIEGIIQVANAIEMENEFLKTLSRLGGPAEATFYSEQSGLINRAMSPNQAAARVQELTHIRDSISKFRVEAETD